MADEPTMPLGSNAALWAESFTAIMRERPEIMDEAFLTGWFESAIMAGHDWGLTRYRERYYALLRELRQLSYYMSLHCYQHPRCKEELETDRERALDDALTGDRSLLTFVREHLVRLEGEDHPSTTEP